MPDSQKYVSWPALWGVLTFIVICISAGMSVAFDWHKENPHKGAIQAELWQNEVGHLRADMNRLEDKLDQLIIQQYATPP